MMALIVKSGHDDRILLLLLTLVVTTMDQTPVFPEFLPIVPPLQRRSILYTGSRFSDLDWEWLTHHDGWPWSFKLTMRHVIH